MSDWSVDLESCDGRLYYIIAHPFGTEHSHTPATLLVAVPTAKGWIVRSTSRDSYNHEYLNYESIEDVLEWTEMECHHASITDNREDLLVRLRTPFDLMAASPAGVFECDTTMGVNERAQQVLQHLERSC